jgi:WD40 repeat protein
LLSGGKDGFLNIWSCKNFELIKSLPAHNFALYGICFHPNENIFATASRDKSIKIWDAETIDVLAKLDAKKGGHLNSVNRIYWSNYNNYLVSTGDDKTIIIWDINIL